MKPTLQHEGVPTISVHPAADGRMSMDLSETESFAAAFSGEEDTAAEIVVIMSRAVKEIAGLIGPG